MAKLITLTALLIVVITFNSVVAVPPDFVNRDIRMEFSDGAYENFGARTNRREPEGVYGTRIGRMYYPRVIRY